MNRMKFLKTAAAIRGGRAGAGQGQVLRCLAGLDPFFAAGAEKLLPEERIQLLATLTQMLERERRKCKARAGRYDAGRHIGLYIAVKSLTANKSPGE